MERRLDQLVDSLKMEDVKADDFFHDLVRFISQLDYLSSNLQAKIDSGNSRESDSKLLNALACGYDVLKHELELIQSLVNPNGNSSIIFRCCCFLSF